MAWVKIYPMRWLTSDARFMPPAARTIYLELLMFLSGTEDYTIPSDHSHLAAIAVVSLEEFEEHWPAVSKYFVPVEGKPGRLTNNIAREKLCIERDEK